MNVLPPSTNNVEFGLQNKNSASERISQIQSVQKNIQEQQANFSNANNDGMAEFGLQDRSTIAERGQSFEALKNRTIQNHGFEAKQNTKEALTNNMKIINIPPLERGSLLDFRV